MSDPILRRIFVEALDQPTAAGRARFLDEACGADAALREQVEVLLRAHDEAGAFLAEPTKRSSPFKNVPTEKPGDWIGRYKLLQQIGEGGCGVVYMAEQEEPIRRRVALKVIKLGMDTKQVIARFEAERQALALMDHPNIAKVLDAGATETGRPYFVMELVRGTKITEYCDETRTSTEDRLGLFKQVCQAIQHAHQKGIIHRDIKPSNILVTINDGVPAPKVIDFGIAKATQGRLTDHTLFTAFEQFIGTPAYMSPEQAVMTSLDIDTRTDIYSLGVLLYELLTGRPPFDQKELLAVGLDEMRRTIRETEPPKPSTRLTLLGEEELTTAAQRRQTEAPKLVHRVRGDLDWIVMKCLEKDRSRRYETANGVAADVQRHLNDEPITARPPSRLYEFQKTVRRHKAGFAGALVLVLTLAIGGGVSTWQAIRATRAEREQARLRLKAEAAGSRETLHRQSAETARKNSDEVARFLKEMLKATGPIVARGRDAALLRELLTETAGRIQKELANQPEVQGDLWAILGDTYHEIGDRTNDIFACERALDSYRRAFVGSHPKLAIALGDLGVAQSFDQQLQKGTNNAWMGLQMARELEDDETIAHCLTRYASALNTWGRGSAEAIPYLREAVEIRKRSGNTQLLMRAYSSLSLSSTSATEKVVVTTEVLKDSILRNGEEHTFTALQRFILGQHFLLLEQPADAEAELRKALHLWRKLHSPNHPYRDILFRLFIHSLALQEKFEQARQELKEELVSSPTNIYCETLEMALKINTGEWQVAPTDLIIPQESSLNLTGVSFNAAIALARTGQMEAYQRCVRSLLNRAEGQIDFVRAEQAAKAALLFPSDASVVGLAGKLADFAATADGPESFIPWGLAVKALAEYRRNNPSLAIEFANRTLAAKEVALSCKALAYYVQALAYGDLGEPTEARAALDSAKQTIPQYRRTVILTHWELSHYWGHRDWIIAAILEREAEQKLSSARE